MLIRSFSADRCRAERNTPCTLCVAAGMMRRSRFLCSCEITGVFQLRNRRRIPDQQKRKRKAAAAPAQSVTDHGGRQVRRPAYSESCHVFRITQIHIMCYVSFRFLSYITYYAVSCHALRITQIPVMRQVKSMLSTSWSFFGS